jgi:Na+:H+ antiporter, NhaA family
VGLLVPAGGPDPLAGRVVGKLAGITAATWLAVRLGLATGLEATSWPQLAGAATVAGIGFTVPLFVAEQAFPAGQFAAPVKLGLLAASVLSGVAGALVLVTAAGRSPPRPDDGGRFPRDQAG